MSIPKVQPGDKAFYCPSGDWEMGATQEAVVLEILGPEAGHREGCIKIKLTDQDRWTGTYATRIVRADKVRVR